METLATRLAVGIILSSAVAARSFRRKSVDVSAVVVGIPIMVIHVVAGYRIAALLLVFFLTSSKLTKIGEEEKRRMDAGFKEGGQRDWKQVLANSVIATILAAIVAIRTDGRDVCLDTKSSRILTALTGGIIGHYACCNGDTWSSEIGMLSKRKPRLITTFETVRKGTNGAVSLEGLLAATSAGCLIGLVYVLSGILISNCDADVAWRQLLVVPIATVAGLCGSLIDSLLGSTLQFSGYCTVRKKVVGKQGPTVVKISGMDILDNNGVNLISTILTTLLSAIACTYVF